MVRKMSRFYKNKQWLKVWLCSLVFLPICLHSVPDKPKKKILVLCSNGGTRRNSAARALKEILSDRFDFKVIYPINQLPPFGESSGEELYNMALRNRWTRSVNMVSKYVAPKLFRGYKKKLEAMI